jgi:hypothetical protein
MGLLVGSCNLRSEEHSARPGLLDYRSVQFFELIQNRNAATTAELLPPGFRRVLGPVGPGR